MINVSELPTEKEVRESIESALKAARKAVKKNPAAMLGYAIGYSEFYLNNGLEYITDIGRIQILYILNNLQTWKGAEARKVKIILRAVSLTM